ncbi:hypothetical protein BY458DRAFT_547599 [Sporodiniella umbellata]|nr:hypothetical protein BY458DRAFT_547599 [Sporodiniella umbellata]
MFIDADISTDPERKMGKKRMHMYRFKKIGRWSKNNTCEAQWKDSVTMQPFLVYAKAKGYITRSQDDQERSKLSIVLLDPAALRTQSLKSFIEDENLLGISRYGLGFIPGHFIAEKELALRIIMSNVRQSKSDTIVRSREGLKSILSNVPIIHPYRV